MFLGVCLAHKDNTAVVCFSHEHFAMLLSETHTRLELIRVTSWVGDLTTCGCAKAVLQFLFFLKGYVTLFCMY